MTEQERQAIEKALEKLEIERNAELEFSFKSIDESKRDFIDGYKKGAEFALSELRKPSENLVEAVKLVLDRYKEFLPVWLTNHYAPLNIIDELRFDVVSREIASLALFNQNAEILEALEALYESLPDGYAHDCLKRVKAILHPIYAERNYQRCDELRNDEF